jgi:hypothetical protein
MNRPKPALPTCLLAVLLLPLAGCEKLVKKSQAPEPAPPAAATEPPPTAKEPAPGLAAEPGEAEELTIVEKKAPPAPAKVAPDENPEYGKIADGTFTSPFFKFSINVPDRRQVATGLELGGVANKGAALLAGDNEGLRERLKLNRPKYFKLLAISEQPLDVPQERNPTIMVVAERLDEPTTGQAYLEQVDALLTNSLLPYQRRGEIEELERGNVTFHLADYQLEKGDSLLYQSYVVTLRRGYALSFIITDVSPESLASLRGYALATRFEPLIGEGGTLAANATGTAQEQAPAPTRIEPAQGTTVFLKEDESERDPTGDATVTTLPELPQLAGSVDTAADPTLEPVVEPELPTMTPRPEASPDSRPAPPSRPAGSGVPAAATRPLPPYPDAGGRDTLKGADEMGATPLEIEPAEAP